MNFEITEEDGINIITVEGNLFGEQQTKDISDKIHQLIEDDHNLFIINLKEMKFINSLGLNFLLSVLTKARKTGGEVLLANISEQLSKLLVITKLNAVFNISDSMEAAKKQISSSKNA